MIRFAAALAAYGALLLWLLATPRAVEVLEPLELATARVTAAAVEVVGLEVKRDGRTLWHPGGFGYRVVYRCTGLTVAGFFAVGLLALPGAWRARRRRLAAGVAILFALNLARLVQLYALGVAVGGERRELYELAHAGWEIALLAVVLWMWRPYLRPLAQPARTSDSLHLRAV